MDLTIKRIETIAKDTKAFYLKTPKTINYLPGQFFYYTISKLEEKDPRGQTRIFSIASSPTEKGHILFATRIREKSPYKQTIASLKVGDKIEGEGPNGTFILDENEKGDHVLLAGGIGITPFRSIIKYNIDKKLNSKLHLIYSNSRLKEIAFRDELNTWAKENSNISISMTITKPKSGDNWAGLTGRINEKFIEKLVENIKNKTFWITGPPSFVEGMEKVLGKLKITSDRVRTEKFSGY